MANCLSLILKSILPETQNGFSPNRGTVDLIFSLRQLQEKVKEHHTKSYTAFIDLAKAFDFVNRDILWLVMKRKKTSTILYQITSKNEEK